ncbi:MAG: hypothetical protein ABJD07_13555 [Gemmatimonadaceae bacterium]
MTRAAARRRIGLGLVAGAVFLAVTVRGGAQVRDTVRRRDSVRVAVPIDSALTIPKDSASSDTTKKAPPKDTIKAPLAHAPLPEDLAIGQRFRWDRASLFASGSISLLDLIERVPGATSFRTGWVATPQHASFLGNARRIRIWYDGVPLDAFDERTGYLIDLNTVPLWSLESVVLERGADELRVYLRTWSVTHTTANTRTDVVSGDQNFNLYRAYYGKRLDNGAAIQGAGQQYGINPPATDGGGDRFDFFVRGGVANKRGWSFDAFTLSQTGSRDAQRRGVLADSIRSFRSTGGVTYLRAAYGDPDVGPWFQLMGVRQKFTEKSAHVTTGTTGFPADTSDTTLVHNRYIATGGMTWRGARLTLSQIGHFGESRSRNVQTARVSADGGLLGISLYGEHRADTLLAEATARLSFGDRIALGGAIAERRGDDGAAWTMSARAEAGIRIRDLWLSGGLLRRGAAQLPALRIFDPKYVAVREPAATGSFVEASGRVWRAVGIDAFAVGWKKGGYYRPRIQTHESVYLRTNWLSRFPSGHFGVVIDFAHEYREATAFPIATEPGVLQSDFSTNGHSLLSRLEIRILDATAFIQNRVQMTPAFRDLVPAFPVRRNFTVYGVRWNFYN